MRDLPFLVLSLSCLASLPAQPRPSEPAAAANALEASVDAAVELAEWGAQHGFTAEAGALIRRVQRVQPGHHSASLLRKIAEAACDEDDDTAQILRRRHAVEHATGLAGLRAALTRALAARTADEGTESLVAVATLDPELPGIGDKLRRTGFELLGGYGPVAAAVLQAARADLSELGGAVASALDLSAVRAQWPDAFGVRTAHFAIFANVDLSLVLEIARHIEAVHAVWEKLAAEAGLQVTAPGKLLEVRIFDARTTFDALIDDRVLRVACARETDTVGVYSFRARLACSYLAGDGAADRRRLIENIGHETVHQMFHLRVRGRVALPVETIAFSWIEEAVCLYSETLDVGAGTALGARCDDDLARGVACAQTDHDPLARVRRVCSGLFLDAGDYGCAALLASCLMEAPDQAWRAAFLGALRGDLDQAESGQRLLRSLGDETAFRAHLEGHAQAVGKRCK